MVGVGHLVALVDARTPLLVADTQGMRIRLGRSWRGLPWGALALVEHRPRRGLFRDGRVVAVVRHPARLIEELDRGGRRQSRLSQRLYGSPFAVPLAVSTRVRGAGEDLTAALTALAGTRATIVEIEDEPKQRRLPWRDPRPQLARAIATLAALSPRRRGDAESPDDASAREVAPAEVVDQPLVASATPVRSATRSPPSGRRSVARRSRPTNPRVAGNCADPAA